MEKQQFSTRDLLVGMTFIAAGMGLMVVYWRLALGSHRALIAVMGCIGGCALIGAGCGSLVRAKAIGAVIGAAIGAPFAGSLIHNFAPWLR